MISEPVKWLKYLKLVEYNLLTAAELKKQVRRFKRDEVDRLYQEVEQILLDAGEGQTFMIVVKLVPLLQQGQLPNFRLSSVRAIDGLRRFVAESSSSQFLEVWYCATNISATVRSVAGRLAFDTRQRMPGQSIEVVWRSSPRMLESYDALFPFPYLRARRYGWGWSYCIEAIHEPKGTEASASALLADARFLFGKIEEQREKVVAFLDLLDSYDLSSYSLEFKLLDSSLFFIDWDTSDDRRVVA